MKTKKLLKALEYCKSENHDCWNCPYSENSGEIKECFETLMENSIKKIKKLKAENKMLRGQDNLDLDCEGCKFERKAPNKKPCKKCSRNYMNKFEPIEGKNK